MVFDTISVLYALLSFLLFLGFGWHILVGYKLIYDICKKINNDEPTNYLEDKILSKSYLSKSIEKITTVGIVSIFLFEIEKYRYSLDIAYGVIVLITMCLYNVSPYLVSVFIGITIFEIISWIYKLLAIKEFKKAINA